ncbi:rhomboid family intramembrane serine protease [Oceaniglobus roseus]|uniref:rhomboid family intramembrane serine protease n=1 Tax=Oceaniglobus roseus TaxID=1737570 RepID=UPI000C7F6F19|nr:rhomboid family intramembrane serine protease [Kandeliimicrobium roseum]
MHPDRNAPPFNPLPPVVWALALPIFVIELVFQAASAGFVGGAAGVGWRLDALNRFAFAPQILEQMVTLGRYPPDQLLRFLTYPFVHQDFTHMLFVVVFVLALGKMVAELFHPAAVLVVFFGAAVFGALCYTYLQPSPVALFGGYPGVYGLIGAYTFILWTGLGRVGENRMRAFTLIGFLLGIQLIFGLLFGGGNAWVAELGGFVAGFLMSFLVSPGGVARVRARLRQR